MIILFVVLIILTSVILGFLVLVQNPKGGGLVSNIGGLSNQFMGVKQTTDVLEKGSWIFATILGLLCICSVIFIPRESKGGDGIQDKNVKPSATTPATPAMPSGPSVPMMPGN